MAIHKLTDLKIESRMTEAHNKGKPILLGDGLGLHLAITKKGTASWLYRWQDTDKFKTIGLGGYPTVTLKQARIAAQAKRVARASGEDPSAAKRIAQQKRVESQQHLFSQVASEYIDKQIQAKLWKNAKHASQWSNTIEQYVNSLIGNKPVSDITIQDIVRVMEPHWASKHETMSRVLGRLKTILDYAHAHGWRTGDNPARMDGPLEHLLPRIARTQTHFASMPYQELAAFMRQLITLQSGMSCYALQFLILCASRTGEVIGAKWEEFDLKAALWRIPATRMKAGREHRVPLTSRCQQILNTVKPLSTGEYVFVGNKSDVPMSNMAMTMLMRRMGMERYTVHGFRSSFRSWAGESTTYPYTVCEQALAHKLPDKVAAAYMRSDFYEHRVNLMRDWEAYLMPAQSNSASPSI